MQSDCVLVSCASLLPDALRCGGQGLSEEELVHPIESAESLSGDAQDGGWNLRGLEVFRDIDF
jgi:hypothetical protein